MKVNRRVSLRGKMIRSTGTLFCRSGDTCAFGIFKCAPTSHSCSCCTHRYAHIWGTHSGRALLLLYGFYQNRTYLLVTVVLHVLGSLAPTRLLAGLSTLSGHGNIVLPHCFFSCFLFPNAWFSFILALCFANFNWVLILGYRSRMY